MSILWITWEQPGTANRVGGGISPPASHTTGHAGPRPAVPGSPNGLSSQSFSATVIAAQCSANRLHRPGNKTTDGRVLPAKFSPSRVVRPSGVIPGSLLSVLRPLLTRSEEHTSELQS